MRKVVIHSKALVLFILCGMFMQCGEQSAGKQPVKGGKEYGGVFTWNESTDIRSIFPVSITQASANRIIGSVYEGLLRINPDKLVVEPALAESWEVFDDGRRYVFNLRKGVKFHDNPCFPEGKGRELKAEDVVKAFNFICSGHEMNQMFWLFQDRVLGANAAHVNSLSSGKVPSDVSGIKALDEYTVSIELAKADLSFLQILAHQGCWIYPSEMLVHYGSQAAVEACGTGPFELSAYKAQELCLLKRNEDYWDTDELGNKLPFLDAIKVNFEEQELALNEFLKGNLCMIEEIPLDSRELLSGIDVETGTAFNVQTVPSMSIQYYCFNVNKEPFRDQRVRKAIAMAIDKEFLADSIFGGLVVPANGGLVPNLFSGYPVVQGIPFDPKGARKLLKEAGYHDASKLPVLNIQFSGSAPGYVEVVNSIQKMLNENLGLNVPISTLPVDQYYELVESGNAGFWREGWLADHPDPENFLALFYGKNAPADTSELSYLNTTRFKDPVFDSLMLEAAGSPSVESRMRAYATADQRLVTQAPVIPLYSPKTTRLVRKDVRDIRLNSIGSVNLGQVWLMQSEN